MSGLIHCLVHKISTRPLAGLAPFEAAVAEWAAGQLVVPGPGGDAGLIRPAV